MVMAFADELCTCVQCNYVCVNMYLQLSAFPVLVWLPYTHQTRAHVT